MRCSTRTPDCMSCRLNLAMPKGSCASFVVSRGFCSRDLPVWGRCKSEHRREQGRKIANHTQLTDGSLKVVEANVAALLGVGLAKNLVAKLIRVLFTVAVVHLHRKALWAGEEVVERLLGVEPGQHHQLLVKLLDLRVAVRGGHKFLRKRRSQGAQQEVRGGGVSTGVGKVKWRGARN